MPRQLEFDKTKALESAMLVFWEKGYEATSVQDLLDAMNLHRGSMYNTFGDKHDLYIAALNHYRLINMRPTLDLVAREESPYETIRILLTNLMERSLNEDMKRGCFINNAMVEMAHDESCSAITQTNTAFLQDLFEKIINQGKEKGEIRQDQDTTAIAHYLVGMIQGMKIMGKNNPDRLMLQNIVDLTLSTIKT